MALTQLDFRISIHSLISVDLLAKLTNISHLELGQLPVFAGFLSKRVSVSGLARMTNCIRLNLFCSTALADVHGLPSSILDLDLSDCESLTSIQGLALLTRCTRLSLYNCCSVKDVGPLSG